MVISVEVPDELYDDLQFIKEKIDVECNINKEVETSIKRFVNNYKNQKGEFELNEAALYIHGKPNAKNAKSDKGFIIDSNCSVYNRTYMRVYNQTENNILKIPSYLIKVVTH